MKTNTREFKTIFNKYILQSINFSDYDYSSPTNQMELFWVTFDQEFNYDNNKKHYPNLQVRLANWLQGLPTCTSFEYTNYGIIQLAISQGTLSEDATDKKKEAIIANYYNFLSYQIMRLSRELGVNLNLFY